MNRDSFTIATAAYITPVGWIVAYIAHLLLGEDNHFVMFHLRQGLGLNLLAVLFSVLLPIISVWVLSQFCTVLVFALYIYCAVYAYKGERRYVPFLGRFFNNAFQFLR